MGFGGFEFIFVLLMFFSGSGAAGHDLLDMLPTDMYWQVQKVEVTAEQLERDARPAPAVENVEKLVKDLESADFKTRNEVKRKLESMGPAVIEQLKPAMKSKDPEVAATASGLVKKFSERGKARDVRQLMAIRTLGERKEKGAVSELTELKGSKQLFVGEYAEQALAAIEGKTYAGADHRKDVAGDLRMLPKETGVVFQVTGLGKEPMTLEWMVDSALEEMGPQFVAPGAQLIAPGAAMKKPDRADMLRRATTGLLKVAERVGDLRLDGVTVGFSENAGNDTGWMSVAVRGKYDGEALVTALKSISGSDEMKEVNEGGLRKLEVDKETVVLMPSDEQLILLRIDTHEDRATVVGKFVAAVQSGGAAKGSLSENAELGALMKKTDTGAAVWGVAKLNKEMKDAEFLKAFDAVTLAANATKEGIGFEFNADGTDAEKAKVCVEEINTGIKAAIPQMRLLAAQRKSGAATVEFLESLKVTQDGGNAKMTGELKMGVFKAMLGEFGPMLMYMDQEEGAAGQ